MCQQQLYCTNQFKQHGDINVKFESQYIKNCIKLDKMDWTDARRPVPRYGHVPLRFEGNVVMRMGTQQRQDGNITRMCLRAA